MKKRLFYFYSCIKDFFVPLLYFALFFLVFKSWKTDIQTGNAKAIIIVLIALFNLLTSYYSIYSVLNNINKLLLLSPPKCRNEKEIISILAGEWEVGDKLSSYEKIYVIIKKFYMLIFSILFIVFIGLAVFVSNKMKDLNQILNAYTYLNFFILLMDVSINFKIEKNIKSICNSKKKTRPNFLKKIIYIIKNIKNKILDYPFVLLSLFMIISVFVIICFCDAEVLPCFNKCSFLLMGDKDKTLYNIAISYFAAYIFYIMQVYLPEKKRQKEKLPKRCAIQREVQLFVYQYLYFWERIYKFDKGINESNIKIIFSSKNLLDSCKKINFAGDSDACKYNNAKVKDKDKDKPIISTTWKEEILTYIARIEKEGMEILRYRKDDIPCGVYYVIHYMLNDSLYSNIKRALSLVPYSTLYQCLPKNHKKELNLDIDKEIETLEIIINWINNEYAILKRKIDNESIKTISKIEYHV